MKQAPRSTKILRVVFLVGMILYFVIYFSRAFTSTIFHLSQPAQSMYALVSAIVFFFSSYISNRRDFKKDVQLAGFLSTQPWFGLMAIGVAIFLVLVDFDTRTARTGILINYFLAMLGFFSAYLVIIFYWFPHVIVASEEQTLSPDPLNGLPKNLQDIMRNGRQSIDQTTINVAAICIAVVVISGFFLTRADSPLTIFVAEIIAAIVIAIIARYIAIQKWQKQTMQSGIPEKKLKAAAKLVGLPWPKIKEE